MDISLAGFVIANANLTTSTSSTTEITTAMDENSEKPEIPNSNDSIQYMIVPLAVFITVIILSAMVYLMARTKRKMISRFYKRVRSQSDYTMLDASDFDQDDDDDNEDDPNECLLAGKLQVENRYDTYPIHSYSQRELYT